MRARASERETARNDSDCIDVVAGCGLIKNNPPKVNNLYLSFLTWFCLVPFGRSAPEASTWMPGPSRPSLAIVVIVVKSRFSNAFTAAVNSGSALSKQRPPTHTTPASKKRKSGQKKRNPRQNVDSVKKTDEPAKRAHHRGIHAFSTDCVAPLPELSRPHNEHPAFPSRLSALSTYLACDLVNRSQCCSDIVCAESLSHHDVACKETQIECGKRVRRHKNTKDGRRMSLFHSRTVTKGVCVCGVIAVIAVVVVVVVAAAGPVTATACRARKNERRVRKWVDGWRQWAGGRENSS